ALRKRIRHAVLKEGERVVVLVIASHALCKRLWSNDLATFHSELDGVGALGPGHCFRRLICILIRALRSIWIGTDLQLVQVLELEVREAVETGKSEIAGIEALREAIEAD